MCRLKSNVLLMFSCCFLVLTSDSFSENIQDNDEPFSRRMTVHKALGDCLDKVYQIQSGELSQEEGLYQLENLLDMVQFMTWYWVED